MNFEDIVIEYCSNGLALFCLNFINPKGKEELVANHGNLCITNYLNLDTEVVSGLAMDYENLRFFGGYASVSFIAKIAFKKSNILFARWCYVRGYTFKFVKLSKCSTKFAQFMKEIDPNFDYAELSDDAQIVLKLANDELTPNAVFEDDTSSEESLKLAILLGCHTTKEKLHSHYKRTRSQALRDLLLSNYKNVKFYSEIKKNNDLFALALHKKRKYDTHDSIIHSYSYSLKYHRSG